MTFTWDEANEAKHFKKHKIHLSTAAFFMEHGEVLPFNDPVHSVNEERMNCVAAYNDHYLWICFTEPEPDVIRIISARLATKREIKYFYERS